MTTQTSPTSKNIRFAQILVGLAALSALLAGVGAMATVADAPDNTLVVELWRTIGFYTFAGLFAFLGYNPRSSRALWSIVIGNKLALTIAGLVLMNNDAVVGAGDLIVFDGALTLLLIVSSVLAGVWRK